MRKSHVDLLLLAVISVVSTLPAEAYLDPNASSVLLQVILGGIAGAGVLIRIFWGRLRDRFTGRRAASAEPPAQPGGTD